MARNDRATLLDHLSVGRKIALIPLFFILVIATIMAYTIITIQEQRTDSEVIRICTRQRDLSQRHSKEVLLISQGLAAEGTNRESRQILMQGVESMTNGGPVVAWIGKEGFLEMAPAPTPQIRETLLEQKKLLQLALDKADEFLKLKRDDPAYKATVNELIEWDKKFYARTTDLMKMYMVWSQGKFTRMIQWEAAIGMIGALLGIIFSGKVSRGITGQLGEVVVLAERIGRGDLGAEKLSTRSTDEVGRLAGVFNAMQVNLRELTVKIRSVTENVNSAAVEILASTQQQAASTKEQAATVHEITATMQEISQSGTQVSDRAKQVATTAEATSVASKSGFKAIQDTNQTMRAIREQVEEVAGNIVALSEKTQAVGEIIATVNEIAEQSNLLALNATIEAAGAGDQGNRFAVVANEMKNLADQAKQCTVQVRTILGDIQKGINSSVMLTEEAVKRVESGKSQAEVTERTIREMTETTEESVQAFQQIIGSANQQQIGFTQVTRGMQDIRQAVEQTAVGTSQLEKAVANLTTLSEQLRSVTGSYRI